MKLIFHTCLSKPHLKPRIGLFFAPAVVLKSDNFLNVLSHAVLVVVLVQHIAAAIYMKKHASIFTEPKLVKYKAAGRLSPPRSISQPVL